MISSNKNPVRKTLPKLNAESIICAGSGKSFSFQTFLVIFANSNLACANFRTIFVRRVAKEKKLCCKINVMKTIIY